MLKENKEKFGFRKLSVGLASVVLGVVAVNGVKNTTVHADTVNADTQGKTVQSNADAKTNESEKPAQVVKEVTPQVDTKADTETVRGGD